MLSHVVLCALARTTQPRFALIRIQTENDGAKPQSVSTSTSPLAVNATPVPARTTAAVAVPTATPSSTAPVPDSQSPTANQPPYPANAAKNKVKQLQHEPGTHSIYSPGCHPFVNNTIHALRCGTRIGYLGLQKNRVSRNLIGASEHPEVITTNLSKEIVLGRVAGPFSSPPVRNFQCNPSGVVHKKHSTAWRTIYYLYYYSLLCP